jgi:hypothetical protein
VAQQPLDWLFETHVVNFSRFERKEEWGESLTETLTSESHLL